MKTKRVTRAYKKRERARLTRREVEDRIADIVAWLLDHPSDDPRWREKVREMHALEIKLEIMETPFRRDVGGDEFRIVNS